MAKDVAGSASEKCAMEVRSGSCDVIRIEGWADSGVSIEGGGDEEGDEGANGSEGGGGRG